MVQLTLRHPLLGDIGSVPFTWFRAPQISYGRFHPSGLSLLVKFDQDVAAPGALERGNCAALLRDAGPLGGGAKCYWQSPDELYILLGSGASILPGDTISIFPGARLTGANLIGGQAAPSVVMVAPPTRIQPPLAIRGSTTVDRCSPMALHAVSTSPRTLTYHWACTDYPPLDAFLRTLTGPDAFLPEGTLLLAQLDRTYTVEVYVSDFLGTASDVAAVAVAKVSKPSLSLSWGSQIVRTPPSPTPGPRWLSGAEIKASYEIHCFPLTQKHRFPRRSRTNGPLPDSGEADT